MDIVREAVVAHIQAEHDKSNAAWRETHQFDQPRLFCSDIGHCPRAAFYNSHLHLPDHPFHAEPTHPFDPYVQEILIAGNVWEHQTGKALAVRYGDRAHWRRDDPALALDNGIWLGHMDFYIEPGDELPDELIIEHKATNPVNFQRKGRLPYPFHVLQVLAYVELLRQKTGAQPPTVLYYRSWNHYAELEVFNDEDGHCITWEGAMNGKPLSGEMEGTIQERMEEYETWWRSHMLPAMYDTPFVHQYACTRTYRTGAYPSCKYLDNVTFRAHARAAYVGATCGSAFD